MLSLNLMPGEGHRAVQQMKHHRDLLSLCHLPALIQGPGLSILPDLQQPLRGMVYFERLRLDQQNGAIGSVRAHWLIIPKPSIVHYNKLALYGMVERDPG